MERRSDVGDRQHQMVGDLVQAHPQTQILSGQAPLVSELIEVRRHDQDLAAGSRDGDVVLAEGPARQVTHHRPGRHRQHHRPEHLHHRTQHGAHGIARVGLDCVSCALAQRRGQPLEERLVGIEAAVGPLAAVDRHDLDATAGRSETECIGDAELGDPGQLDDLDAFARIDVALGFAVVRQGEGDLACCAPLTTGAARTEEPTEVAEERHAPEGKLRRVAIAGHGRASSPLGTSGAWPHGTRVTPRGGLGAVARWVLPGRIAPRWTPQ